MNVQEQLLQERIDPSLVDPKLSELARRALKTDVTTHGYRVLTGGCWNRVIAVGLDGYEDADEVVFKISPKEDDAGIRREYDVLRYFNENTEMPVPEPLLFEGSGETIPGTLLIMRKLPGEVMHQCFHLLSRDHRERITRSIAGYVRDLHEKTERGFGGVELEPEKRHKRWADFWLPRFDSVMEEVSGGDYISSTMLSRIHELRPKFGDVLDIGEKSTLTHYDIWSGNVMIDTEASPPEVSGFIDVPGIFADYAREISFMVMFGVADERFFDIYRERHSLDAGFLVRLHMYNLKMHIKHITMYPRELYYRRGAEECLAYIQKHLG